MLAWTSDDLERIGAAEGLQLASVTRDGMLRRPVTLWVVGCIVSPEAGTATLKLVPR